MSLKNLETWFDYERIYGTSDEVEVLYRNYIMILSVRRFMLETVKRTIGLPKQRGKNDLYFLDMDFSNLGVGVLIRHGSDIPGKGHFSYYTYEPSAAEEIAFLRRKITSELNLTHPAIDWITYDADYDIREDNVNDKIFHEALTLSPLTDEKTSITLNSMAQISDTLYNLYADRVKSLFRKYLPLIADGIQHFNKTKQPLILRFQLPALKARSKDFLSMTQVRWDLIGEMSQLQREFLYELKHFNRKPALVFVTFIMSGSIFVNGLPPGEEDIDERFLFRPKKYFDVFTSLEPEDDPMIGAILNNRSAISQVPLEINRMVAGYLDFQPRIREIEVISNNGTSEQMR